MECGADHSINMANKFPAKYTVTKISFMQELREDKLLGLLATSHLLFKLEKKWGSG
jgi:hypothetical protein